MHPFSGEWLRVGGCVADEKKPWDGNGSTPASQQGSTTDLKVIGEVL